MDAEEVLKLLDTNWFETTIFTNKTPPLFLSPVDSTTPQSHVKKVLPLDSKLMRIPTLQVRSFKVPRKKKMSHGHRRRFRKGKATRSLSDLEFKELKGFMDLGFVFSEEDKDSKLVSLIPGLQRLGIEDVGVNSEEKIDETVICRPYLSEAWGVLDQRKVVNPLLNWRVPVVGNEIDIKDNLRFWAHTVASIVR
uniref:Uncharacterized protein n=1 Tax=Cajanus cajan TaxID=3821 RepID=A0A151RRC1_CAJCA|nr:hypothetical protein KK1_033411 [Cajanus cajan]